MNLGRTRWLPLALLLAACSRPEPLPEPVRAVRTMSVAMQAAPEAREYAAEIRARTEAWLGFRIGGKLMQREVNLGQRARQGQLLARLDPEDMRLAQAAARAAMQGAQVNMELADADFRRFSELRAQGFISSAELDRRDAILKAARATYEQARAQAQVQSNQAAYAELRANEGGVVTAVVADPGTVLAAGAPVVRLALDGPRDAWFSVPEDGVERVRGLLGRRDALRVRPWGSIQALPATVREVAAAADPSTRTFLVKADIGPAGLQLGQTATVLIETPAPVGVATLPLAAVTEQHGKSAVWLVDPASMTVRLQPIAVSEANGNSVVVASGLSAGQTVVTAGVHALTPGQKVRYYDAAAARLPPRASALPAPPASR